MKQRGIRLLQRQPPRHGAARVLQAHLLRRPSLESPPRAVTLSSAARAPAPCSSPIFAKEPVNFFCRTLVLLCHAVTPALAELPLTLKQVFPLPGVQGRFDHFAQDEAGHRLFVAAAGNHTAEALDLSNGKLLDSLTGFGKPHGLAWIPSSGRLFVADGDKAELAIYAGSPLQRIKFIALSDDADDMVFDHAHHLLYIGHGGSDSANPARIAVIDTEALTLVENLPVAAHPEALELDPETDRIFANIADAGTIAVIDGKSHTRSPPPGPSTTPGATRRLPSTSPTTSSSLPPERRPSFLCSMLSPAPNSPALRPPPASAIPSSLPKRIAPFSLPAPARSTPTAPTSQAASSHSPPRAPPAPPRPVCSTPRSTVSSWAFPATPLPFASTPQSRPGGLHLIPRPVSRIRAALAAELLLLCLPASSQQANVSADRLRFVLILSRHGVRSPTWTNARLDEYSLQPWPTWPVAPGKLTQHGKRLLTLFGQYDRASLADQGLLPPTGCAGRNDVFLGADTPTSATLTARAALPNASSPVATCSFTPLLPDGGSPLSQPRQRWHS